MRCVWGLCSLTLGHVSREIPTQDQRGHRHGLCPGALFVVVGGLDVGHGRCGGDTTEFQEAVRPHAYVAPCADLKVRVLRETKERTLQHNTMDVNEKHNTVYKDTRKMRDREWGRKAVNKSGPFQDPCVCFNRGM